MKTHYKSEVSLKFVKGLLLALLHYCTIAPGTSFADTTWVSGAVSGEWTREGNPYIVIDSTWVPEGDTLLISSGVRLHFAEGTALDIYGRFDINGTEEDSVFIGLEENAEYWRGIRFRRRDQSAWSYCSLTCPDTAIFLAGSFTLCLEDCNIQAEERLFASYRGSTPGYNSWIIDITSTYLKSYLKEIRLFGGRFVARGSIIDAGCGNNRNIPEWSGIQGYETSFYIENSSIIGDCAGSEPANIVFVNSNFFRQVNGNDISVKMSGWSSRIEDCYIEGDVSIHMCPVNSDTLKIINSEIQGILRYNDLNGTPIIIDNSDIYLVRSTQELISIIKNSRIAYYSLNHIVDLRMSHCKLGNTDGEMNYPCFFMSNGGVSDSLIIDHCTFKLTPYGITMSSFYMFIQNCTFICDSVSFNDDLLSIYISNLERSENKIWVNNIFKVNTLTRRLFGDITRFPPVMQYNCFSGIENLLTYPEIIQITDVDSTNIITDPLLEYDNGLPYLSQNSPCIDRGDPNAPLDPDGTRSDIGAFFYDYRLDIKLRNESYPPTDNIVVKTFPNPFNSRITIEYQSPVNNPVRISLYDLSGRLILQREQHPFMVGFGQVELDTHSLPTGKYLLNFDNSLDHKVLPINCLR